MVSPGPTPAGCAPTMPLLRIILFWLHLAAGLMAGLIIAILCLTGAALAFEKQLADWSERDGRHVVVPQPAVRLPLAELAQRVQALHPEATSPTFTVSADPRQAVACALSRERTLHLNPYDGSVLPPPAHSWRPFFRLTRDVHRWLALDGPQRPLGKAVTGASNLVFTFLALSGLYLWWPRSWSWRGVKAIVIFNRRLTGKARDFNWHNAIGLWCAPVLIVLTLTAVPISYRWGGTLIERLAGSPPAAESTPPAKPAAPAANSPTPAMADWDESLRTVQALMPEWQAITLKANGPATITATVRAANTWPRTATTTLTLTPLTGDVLKREGHAEQPLARRIRAWTRFLHTGEALGWPGQLVAGLACIGGCVLAYTGFALSWRRFFGPKKSMP